MGHTIEFVFPAGEPRLFSDVTALVNNTSKTVDLIVPDTAMYLVYGGSLQNNDDVARTLSVSIMDSTGNIIIQLIVSTAIAAGDYITFPCTVSGLDNYGGSTPLPLPAGSKIRYSWNAGGASTGGSTRYSLLYQRIDT